MSRSSHASPHPQHQHHGPRQHSSPCVCPLSAPHSSPLFSLSFLYKLIHHYVLLVLATLIGLISLFSGPIPPALAHSPPRPSYYEVTSNPVRSMLASSRFGRLPISPYYASSYSRRYSPSLSAALKDSKTSLGAGGSGGKTTDPNIPNGRSLMDPYYYYDYHREPEPREPLPIPSCKELRLMWLANQFARYHSTYRDNHHKGISWLSHIPEINKLLDSVLQSRRKNKPTSDTSDTQSSLTNSVEQNEIGQFGAILSGKDDHQSFGKMAVKPLPHEPPVYISKIVPSNDFEQSQLGERPSSSQKMDEMAFGIIHTSPDDGDEDQEELMEGKNIQQLPSKSNTIKHKVGQIDDEVRVDRNGNRAIFGKFIDTDKTKQEKTLGVSNRTTGNERKSVKVDSAKPTVERESKTVGSSASRSRFQSNRMPGVWHNKPVVPSVRII